MVSILKSLDAWQYISWIGIHIFLWFLKYLTCPEDVLPTFEDNECPPDSGMDLCVKVTFGNGVTDILLLTRDSPNSTVYEGVLKDEVDASVVLIDAPEDSERIVSLITLFRLSHVKWILFCSPNLNFV